MTISPKEEGQDSLEARADSEASVGSSTLDLLRGGDAVLDLVTSSAGGVGRTFYDQQEGSLTATIPTGEGNSIRIKVPRGAETMPDGHRMVLVGIPLIGESGTVLQNFAITQEGVCEVIDPASEKVGGRLNPRPATDGEIRNACQVLQDAREAALKTLKAKVSVGEIPHSSHIAEALEEYLEAQATGVRARDALSVARTFSGGEGIPRGQEHVIVRRDPKSPEPTVVPGGESVVLPLGDEPLIDTLHGRWDDASRHRGPQERDLYMVVTFPGTGQQVAIMGSSAERKMPPNNRRLAAIRYESRVSHGEPRPVYQAPIPLITEGQGGGRISGVSFLGMQDTFSVYRDTDGLVVLTSNSPMIVGRPPERSVWDPLNPSNKK